ncbi:MAG: hypothetical protein P9M14_06380 [Candidatus Alcyoniella australis]|nr:hypothetical protein [Candidatus Alcyoniella australis]
MSSRSILALSVLCLAAAIILWSMAEPLQAADASTLFQCARQQWQRNQAAYSDYQCTMTSDRKVWHLNGELERHNVLVKRVYFKPPNMRREVFISGTMNDEPAQKKDFIFERLGLDNSLSVGDLELFRIGAEQQFAYEAPGIKTRAGEQFEVLKFRSLQPKKTELQQGRLFLDPDTCMLRRIEGEVINRLVQTNRMKFSMDFSQVRPDVWLPSQMTIEGVVKMVLMKRKTFTRNVFSDYRLDLGLSDELFD